MTLCNTDEFLQNLKNHDSESFELLYAAYGSRIYNLAYRLTGNQSAAEDITQETFLQIYSKIGTFRAASQLYTWIYAITKNLCYQFFKQAKKSSFLSLEALMDAALETEPTAATKTLETMEREKLIRQVKEGCLTGLLRCLSFYQRAAFVLHILLHLPIWDVAEILGKSEGAVKVLIHRAKRNLKTFLCKNCSLYNPDNRCHCENLVDFSLRQGWLQPPPTADGKPITSQQIEAEIKAVREVTELYSQLTDSPPTYKVHHRLQEWIHGQRGIIFTDPV
ncbi:MAG TPA: RNA polymerase sigma factor [Phototrophicaceae bacterium]|nr:RNA polymerase sigma factor [Phototrophicaceae bacterium]